MGHGKQWSSEALQGGYTDGAPQNNKKMGLKKPGSVLKLLDNKKMGLKKQIVAQIEYHRCSGSSLGKFGSCCG